MSLVLDQAIDQALEMHRAGRLAEAEKYYLGLLATAPNHPELLHLIGVVALQTDRPSRAVDFIKQAVAADPGQARYQNNLGNAVKATGDGAGAEAAYRLALAIAPDFASAHSNLALLNLERGAVMTALSGFDRAVELDPALSDAHCNGGHALRILGRQGQAVKAFREAVKLEPERGDYWVAFADGLRGLKQADTDAGLAADIVAMLKRSDVEHQILAPTIAALLALEPAMRPWLQGSAGDGAGLEAVAEIPLLTEALPRLVLTHPAMEQALQRLRHAMLQFGSAETPSAALVSFAAGLAANAYLVDYVWQETAAETALIDHQIAAFSWSDGTVDAELRAAFSAAVIGAYRPLWQLDGLPDALRLADEAARRAWTTMICIQVAEPREEAAARSAPPPAAWAEQVPYPRWRSVNQVNRRTVATELRRQFPYIDLTRFAVPSAPSILVPDCGTGRSAIAAVWRFGPERLRAVDGNQANLAFARRMAAQCGVADRIDFVADDDGDPANDEAGYHVILASRALLRAADPLAVWHRLLERLEPGGVMKVALLSEAARAGVVAARAMFADRGFADDLGGLRAFREHLMASAGATAGGLAGQAEFYSAIGCRELLLRQEERCFSLAELALALDVLGVVFLGLEHGDQRITFQYAERFADDPERTHLGNWAEWEAEQPTLFGSAYQVWVLKP